MLWRRRKAAAPEQAPAATVAEELDRAQAAATGGDYAAALAIWGPLAQAGVSRAQNNVGACLSEGLGVPRDGALARRWFLLAAEAGDAVAQRNLAALLFKGEGVEADYPEAARWYRKAAEQGDAAAQDMLSWMLLEGEMIASDPQEARRFALAAAEQGIATAMTRLGMLYHNALGVDRDAAMAALWWQRAADLGEVDAHGHAGGGPSSGARRQPRSVSRHGAAAARQGRHEPARRAVFSRGAPGALPGALCRGRATWRPPVQGGLRVIVGTAGHIDHGKSALVRALTGVDPDRLKEEKARGITIDLGFAYWPQPDGGVIGFVDVPGHERFVHTMLAGRPWHRSSCCFAWPPTMA
jgi:uncharacterized protein